MTVSELKEHSNKSRGKEIAIGDAVFNKDVWAYYFSFFKGFYRRLFFTSLGSASQTLLIIPMLLLVRYAFDVLIPEKNISMLILSGVVIFLLRIANSSVSLWMRWINIKIINRAIFRLRSSLLEKVYSLSRSFYTGTDLKILHARLVQDTERLTNLSTAIISNILPSVIISAALCIVLGVLNIYLFLLIIAVFPIVFLSARLMARKIRKKVYSFQRSFENFSRNILFFLKYLDLIYVQSAKKSEFQRQSADLERLKNETGRMAFVYALNNQLQTIMTGLSGIVIIIAGGIAVASGRMSLGDFLAFYLAAVFLNNQLNNIMSALPEVVAGNESAITLYKLATHKETYPYTGTKKVKFSGNILIKDIHFAYDKKQIINSLSLEVKSGESIAISGKNGSGKTSLVNIILGFYKPQQGKIYAEGVDYEEVCFSSLLSAIGVVTQNPLLFPGSIRENICFGSEEESGDSIHDAAEIACASDFISRLPEKYETEIGDDGCMLSGGERQRIAIARALLRKPKLLILDEPGNHLEKSIIEKIMRNISALAEPPALILISHDQSLVSLSSKVFLLDDGTLKLITNSN